MQTARLTTAAKRDIFIKKARFKEQWDWSNRVHYNSTKHLAYHLYTRALYMNICKQSTLTVILSASKSEKLYQDAIMTEQGSQLDFDLLHGRKKDDFGRACNFNKMKLTLIY